jgi:predicted O-methyltransferase YrrM
MNGKFDSAFRGRFWEAGVANFLITRSFRFRNFLQQLMCETREVFDFAADHPLREMRKLASAETVAYIQKNMASALGVYTKRQFLDLALKRVKIDGHYVEFGVYRGGSIRHIASRVRDKIVVGFDCFEGLPEDWLGDIQRGALSLQGKLPKVPRNVELQPGWFDVSIPLWLKANPEPFAFIHIDCDVYSSTKTILDLISSRIVPGTVIAFDEYFGYPHWQQHEFKAFQEYVQENEVGYEYASYAKTQAALVITGFASPANRQAPPTTQRKL